MTTQSRSAFHKQIEGLVHDLGVELGLQPGFYERLLSEPNDWAFVIQLQVLAEAFVTHVIVWKMGEGVRDHVENLTFLGRTGKVPLAASLGILEPDSLAALKALAFVRNRFAHRIEAMGAGSLRAFGDQLTLDQKINLLRDMDALSPDEATERAEGCLHFGANLRYLLWIAAASALADCSNGRLRAELERLRHEAKAYAPLNPLSLLAAGIELVKPGQSSP